MKTPKAKKLPSGSWRTQVKINGKAISITAPTKKECEVQAMLLKSKYQTGQTVSIPADITLDKAIEEYIASRDRILSPSTIRGYDIIRRNRFKDIMNKPIKSVKNWQAVVNNESVLCSEKTLKNAWGFVRSVLKECGVDPGNVRLPVVVPKEMPFLSPEEIKIFVKAIYEDTYELPYLLCLHGLRRSEMFALEKSDISKTEITVHKAKVPGVDHKMAVKPRTKNASSSRSVPVLIPRLWELVQDKPEGLLVRCCDKNLNYHLARICRNNNITVITLHGLRHSFASLCYHLRISELQAMKFGGWADLTVMRKIYTHIGEADQNAAVSALRSFFV